VQEVNTRFLCPITGEPVEDPVVAEDGHSYERTAIRRWLRQCDEQGKSRKSPMTGEVMGGDLVANATLRALMEDAGIATRPVHGLKRQTSHGVRVDEGDVGSLGVIVLLQEDEEDEEQEREPLSEEALLAKVRGDPARDRQPREPGASGPWRQPHHHPSARVRGHERQGVVRAERGLRRRSAGPDGAAGRLGRAPGCEDGVGTHDEEDEGAQVAELVPPGETGHLHVSTTLPECQYRAPSYYGQSVSEDGGSRPRRLAGGALLRGGTFEVRRDLLGNNGEFESCAGAQ